jgi:hypothetical protein
MHKDLQILYASPNIRVIKSKKDEIGGACTTHERDRKCIQNFDRKT